MGVSRPPINWLTVPINIAAQNHAQYGRDDVSCQYQVQYDKDTRVNGLFWREKSREAYVNPPQPKPVQNVSLGADGLFAFGGSSFNDLQPVGKEKLNRLAQQIRDGYNLKSIMITGHTDRIGSDAKNMVLSQNRDNTVKQYLAAQGISNNLIATQSVGSSQPKVTCAGPASKAVVACLQLNRRVDIVIEGAMKYYANLEQQSKNLLCCDSIKLARVSRTSFG